MLDKRDPRRRASQPLVVPQALNQETLPRASSFLLTGLKAWRPRPKRKQNEATARRNGRRDSNTRRVSAGSGSSDNEKIVEILFSRSKHSSQDDKEEIQGVSTSGDADMSSRKTSRHLWQRFGSPKAKAPASPATVMYSISFYPWRMESRGYYSHPEAAANWVPDTASSRCQICLAAFTLTHRRHHCRLCGHLVCATCSHDRTYLPFTGSAPSQHRLIKDGAPQRTCSACASTLRNMAGQDDPRVKRFTVAVSSVRCRQSTPSLRSSSSSQSVVAVEVERPSPWLQRTGKTLTNSDLEDEEFFLESTKALRLDQRSRGTTHHFPLRLSVTRAEELDEVLSARACSRVKTAVENSSDRQFVMSSAWLEQWLQYVRVDPASADAATSNSSVSQLAGHSKRHGKRRSKLPVKCRLTRPRRPGPVTNYVLLDFVNGELVPKPKLQRSKGSYGAGDYRVVSQEVWMTFLELYSGGPSIQVSLNNDAESPPWIITELDDSVPALASAPPIDKFSSATRTGPGRRCVDQTECKPRPTGSVSAIRSTPGNRLISTASMPLIMKKTTSQFSCRSESASSSCWKRWEDGGQVETKVVTTIERRSARDITEEGSATLSAVSAFASAATLARQHSAASLSRHSAAVPSRTNGSTSETE